jgi:hypothetical protein
MINSDAVGNCLFVVLMFKHVRFMTYALSGIFLSGELLSEEPVEAFF